MKKISAGLLMYRLVDGEPEFFLAHPGGPYLKNKDLGFWGIPKGEVEEGDPYLDAAIREFDEETGIKAVGQFIPLGSVVLRSGKTVFAWAFHNVWDATTPVKSNLFALEWPPHSGQKLWFPEIDQAAFFAEPLARKKITPAQAPFLDRLKNHLAGN